MARKVQKMKKVTLTPLAAIEYLKRLEKQLEHHYTFLEQCIEFDLIRDYMPREDTLDDCLNTVYSELFEIAQHTNTVIKRLTKIQEKTDAP